MPLGIFAARRPRLAAPLVALANIVQTIPSLAMFGFLLPVPLVGGVGARAALVVLILYGLLPIVRTTIAGLSGIDPSIREAGVAMGMTPRELLRQVELPLALPSIVAGVRVAAVVGVGSATIAAAIGAGGLGEYIYRGLSMVDSTVILAGAIPAALLALVVDGWPALARDAAVGAPPIAVAPRRRPWRPPIAARSCCSSGGARAHAGRAARSSSARRTSPSSSSSASCSRRRSSARRAAGRSPAESRRHADLRSRAADRRHRRLRRVHRHRADRHLPSAGQRPIAGAVFDDGARPLRDRPAARCCRRSASTTRSRSWSAARMRASGACAPSTMRRAKRRDGAPASATSSSSGRTAIPGWRSRTGSGFSSRRA